KARPWQTSPSITTWVC
ncbi:lysM domain protein, partial [Vibrio parahaemolyticus V-223/04]